jgi:hypothetical protein
LRNEIQSIAFHTFSFLVNLKQDGLRSPALDSSSTFESAEELLSGLIFSAKPTAASKNLSEKIAAVLQDRLPGLKGPKELQDSVNRMLETCRLEQNRK